MPLSHKHFVDHLPDLRRVTDRSCERIHHERLAQKHIVTRKRCVDGQSLRQDVDVADGGTAHGQIADSGDVHPVSIDVPRDLHYRVRRQVGDASLIAHIEVASVDPPGLQCLYDVRPVLYAAVFGIKAGWLFP